MRTEFENTLGSENLRVATQVVILPGRHAFKPILTTMNFFMSSNAKSVLRVPVIKFLNFLSLTGTQAIFANIGHIPTNPNVESNPINKSLLNQSQNASYLPNEFQLAAIWNPTDEMIQKVLLQDVVPGEAISVAVSAINQANFK
jgi:maltose-binding protein MalE